jgi:hypothetical protein
VDIMAIRVIVVAGVMVLLASAVVAQEAAPIPENYYAAGETVRLPAAVIGDAVVAGRIVTIARPVSGDVLAAGWRVTLAAPAEGDVRAAGAQVDVTAPVGGDLTAAAADLTIERDARIGGRAWLTGRTVRLDGVFERNVRIAAERVVIGGDLRQPVHVIAQTLELLPTARIAGSLTYEGPTPAVVASGAAVSQPISYKNIPSREVSHERWPRGLTTILFGLHLFFGGLLLLVLLPRLARGPADALRNAPGRSFAAGVALLVTIPFVALLLIISLVGLPTGLVLGAAYASALFVGVVTTAIVIGNVEAQWLKMPDAVTIGQRAKLLLAGVVTLAVLRAMPVIGSVVVFVSIVLGLGAIGMWTYEMKFRPGLRFARAAGNSAPV